LTQLSLPPFLSAVVDWLRAGYPQGIPEPDYVPLLALLARRLTAEEVAAVAAQLQNEGRLPATNTDIGELIMGITDELPRNETWREYGRSWQPAVGPSQIRIRRRSLQDNL
jgi:hypothetical protein